MMLILLMQQRVCRKCALCCAKIRRWDGEMPPLSKIVGGIEKLYGLKKI